MVHCPLSGCHLLRDIISRGGKTIMANLSSVHRLRDVNFLFVSLWIPIPCARHWFFFFSAFCNVRLQLSSLCYFLAEVGMVTFHTSNPSYKAERDMYIVLGFFLVHNCYQKLTILSFPLWNTNSNLKIKTIQLKWEDTKHFCEIQELTWTWTNSQL